MRVPLRHKSRFIFILFLVTLIWSAGQVQVAAAPSDIRFGAVEAYHAPTAAWQAGVAWERVRFHWAHLQAGGESSWDDGEFTDEVLAGELAAGREVVGLLIGLPDWANENGIPRGLNLPHTDPGNTWATFVRRIVGRYAGRIDHWILWNEPDVWDSSHPGHTWSGSVQDFLQLNRVGYTTAKETNPNAVIHLSAFTHWWDAAYGRELYFQRFLTALVADPNAAGNNYYFDVATLHLYFQPHYVFDITSYYYGLMGSYGIWKPIWIVETNAAPSMDPAWPVENPRFHISLEEQAAYMPQALAMGMAAGAQRIGIYKLIDTAEDKVANPEPFGLIRADGSYRPAFYTFQIATSMLAGATRVTRDRWDDVGQVTLEQPGGTTTVLFSRVPGPRTVQVPAQVSTATWLDMWGNGRAISSQDGYFNVELPAAPCSQSAGEYCIIGGPTFYLIQGSNTPPPAAPGPEPSLTASPAESLTPTMTFTPLPTPTETARPTRTPAPTLVPTVTSLPTATALLSPTPEETLVPTGSPTSTSISPTSTSISPTSTSISPPRPEPSVSAQEHDATDSSFYAVLLAAFLLVFGLAGLVLWRRSR